MGILGKAYVVSDVKTFLLTKHSGLTSGTKPVIWILQLFIALSFKT